MGDYKTIALVLILGIIGFKRISAAVVCSSDDQCLNGGTCNDAGDACACLEGFSGALCNTFVCSSDDQCLNGGSCNDAGDACACLEGFSGAVCNTYVCSTDDQCLNGGTCNTDTECTCLEGYFGAVCNTSTTPATRMQGDLQCHSCSTNSISDVCSTADELAGGSGVSTVTCYEGQRCWTDHYENSSHTIVSRGCTDEECRDLHEGGGPYCTMANGATHCTSCCTESKCNDNKSSSEGLISSCVTWLTSLFSVVIMLITYRT